MFQKHSLMLVAAAAVFAAGCGPTMQGSAAGDVLNPVDAAQTAVLHVQNLGVQSVEIHTVMHGDTRFIGAVTGQGNQSMLLDPTILPTGFLYVVAVPTDGSPEMVRGPLTVAKGDRIDFTVEPGGYARAVVVPQKPR
jgi:hypothetical protein